ncbi:3-phosphoshikimate 1-carboxyvinyltransferase [Spirochaetia bacterium]|nr:3-phosphoshikimate 1-carboxyvinyltransferase [Spirochaetia bacterium]
MIMRTVITPHRFAGTFRVPASKSHSIRRLLIAALADGVSEIEYPLDSLDARSCVRVCRALGAEITEHRAVDAQCANPANERGEKLVRYTVRGIGFGSDAGGKNLKAPTLPLDVGNSGTTLFLALAIAALGSSPIGFDGDEQIRRRSAAPLLEALAGLGIRAESKNNNGCAPFVIQGPWRGGRVSLACPTSQYLSALLLAAPLAPAGVITEIDVPLLNERPYIEMTLSYLDAQGIRYETDSGFSWFRIPGGGSYKSMRAYGPLSDKKDSMDAIASQVMSGPVPGDFSSAAFPGAAAAISGGPVTLLGLDPGDPQGDKAIFGMLEKMGAGVKWEKIGSSSAKDAVSDESAGFAGTEWKLTVSRSGPLKGGEFDLNDTPDLLPIMAVLGCYAAGTTALVNVAHARIKETDRIAVMASVLGKLGADAEERPDGIIIHGNSNTAPLHSGTVDGHGDHRVVMALAAAALGATGPVEITGAESAAVTYPGFLELLDGEMSI